VSKRRRGRPLSSMTPRALKRRSQCKTQCVGRPQTSSLPRAQNDRRRYAEHVAVNKLRETPCGTLGVAEHITSVIKTRAGKRAFPEFHHAQHQQVLSEQPTQALRAIISNTGGKNKQGVILLGLAGSTMTPKSFANLTGENARTVRNVRDRARKKTSQGQALDIPLVTEQSIGHDGAEVSGHESDIYVHFFKNCNVTSNVSGDSMQPRKLLVGKRELNNRLFALYPRLLREAVSDNPGLHEWAGSADTKFKKDIIAACSIGPEHDDTVEYDNRYLESSLNYSQHLLYKQAASFRSRRHAGQNGNNTRHDKPNDQWKIKPVFPVTFWKIIKKAGLKYRAKWRPHPCPIHDDGPTHVIHHGRVAKQAADNATELADINCKISALSLRDGKIDSKKKKELLEQAVNLEQQNIDIQTRQRFLKGKVDEYHRHLEQYNACRPYMFELEQSLQKGECIVYRDFVNQYSDEGHVSNLVFVILSRDNTTGLLKVRKVHNFCTNPLFSSCDTDYVATVFDWHLSGKSHEFANFTKIYISGDHGPHFAAAPTMYRESMFKNKYDKHVELVFLCSYHAFNRCDRAGLESKLLAQAQQLLNSGPITAQQFAALINASHDAESVAYSFPVMNKPVCTIKWATKLYLSNYCEVRFWDDFPGILSARAVPGKGRWTNVDIVQRKVQDKMCLACEMVNSKHNTGPVKPVFHADGQPCLHVIVDDEEPGPLPVPDSDDIIQGYREAEGERKILGSWRTS